MTVPQSMPPWCRSCGAAGMDADRCGVCGVSGDPPDSGPERVGLVVRLTRGSSGVLGLAIAQAGETVELAVPSGWPTRLPAAEFDLLPQVSVPGPAVIGAAGRIWTAASAVAGGELRAEWAEAAAAEAARRQADAGLGARRAAAVDRIALGLPRDPQLGDFGLSATELAWYSARQACLSEPIDVLLDRLERFPAQGYAARVGLLLARAGELTRDPGAAARAAAQVEPFARASPDAAALLAALSTTPPPGILDSFSAYLGRIAAEADSEDAEQLSLLGRAVLDMKADQTALPSEALPDTRALALYVAGLAGRSLNAHAADLARLPLTLLDQLADAGALTAATAADPAWPEAVAAYLRCRLDPEGASDEHLRTIGFTAECARRAFLAGDAAALAALPDDESTRHYRVLATWTDGSGECLLDGLRPAERTRLGFVIRLRQRIADAGTTAELPAEVAADPTCWPLLRAEASAGDVMADDTLRADFPRCADWLDLCRLERLVYLGEWRAASTLGAALVDRAEQSRLRDEARNLAALATCLAADAASGLRLLEPALAPVYPEVLLINAAVLAAEQGADAALPYLRRLAVEADDERLRDAAVAHAADVWLTDAGSPYYPQVLRDLVRETLDRPCPDGLLWKLLRLTCTYDREWLAVGGRVAASGADAAVDYWRARARSTGPDRRQVLDEVAQVLVTLHRSAAPPPWLPGELAWLADLLDKTVHRPFGEAEAIACGPVIETLAAARMLSPDRQLYLPAQVGAHLAAHADSQNRGLAPETERNLIFDPCEEYLAGRHGLDEHRRAKTGKELTRCLAAAAGALVRETDRQFAATAQPWIETLRRFTESHSGAVETRARLRRLVGGLDALVDRLGVYLRLLDEMPRTNEIPHELRKTLAETVAAWAADTARMRASI